MNKELTVILPCAGEGKRLGLSYPKELFEIKDNFKLIDFSLSHIKYFINKENNLTIKIVVVVNPYKISVFQYVKEKLPEIDVKYTFFNDSYYEWAGSVYSANEYFTENNFVLLPDSVIVLDNQNPFENNNLTLIESAYNNLQERDVVFGTIFCNEKDKIKNLGACFVKNKKVLKFQDKPKKNLAKFNAFWGCYGFKKTISKEIYNFLKNSIKHKYQNYEKKTFYPFGSFDINYYCDLGTWESIEKFKASLILERFLRYNRF
ncbi:MAG TPA: sugar phosphate nucleotidyltransferase [Spirochaetota bacterium]|nr:sugar phosphate nucleotidyltransferase [Spirochaetota bacterium]